VSALSRTEARSRRSAHARLASIACAAVLAASCTREQPDAEATGEAPPSATREQEQAPPPLLELRADASTPRALLESLLVAAQRTRLAQARSAQLSWNTVADLLQSVGGDSPYLERLREGCPEILDVAAFAALEWTWLDERALPPSAEGAERRQLLFTLQAYGIAIETPFPRGGPLEVALRLPLWILRRCVPPGAPHPVRPRFTECVRGTARPRTWLLAIEVQATAAGWRFAGDTIWIEGLLLVTDVS
jgi:hypothetical protein